MAVPVFYGGMSRLRAFLPFAAVGALQPNGHF